MNSIIKYIDPIILYHKDNYLGKGAFAEVYKYYDS